MTLQALIYTRITHRHMAEVIPLLQLYEEAFPVYERRDSEQLLQLLDLPEIHCYIPTAGNQFAGFYIYWPLDGFWFLEHIAVSPALRGQGFGRQFIQRMLPGAGIKLMLEVERPTDEISRRRIHFYQNVRFTLYADYDYYQPPYRKGESPVPLYLMAAPPLTDTTETALLARSIKQQVYERFYG